MKNVNGYIYRGNGKLTIISIPENKIGTYTNKGRYFIAPSKEELISHYENGYEYHIINAKTNDEREKYEKLLKEIINDINNGEVEYMDLT